MESTDLSKVQQMATTLKVIHDVMQKKTIKFMDIQEYLIRGGIKSHEIVATAIVKSGIIRKLPGDRYQPYEWTPGVNVNIMLAKRVLEKKSELMHNYIERRNGKTPGSEKQEPMVTVKASELQRMESRLLSLERKLSDGVAAEKRKPTPKRKMKFQSPISVNFSIKLRKMIYFI